MVEPEDVAMAPPEEENESSDVEIEGKYFNVRKLKRMMAYWIRKRPQQPAAFRGENYVVVSVCNEARDCTAVIGMFCPR